MLRIVLGLVFAAGVTFVALNAHMDIFQCVRKDMNFQTDRVESREDMCSLLYVFNQEHAPGEGGELTPVGWATAAGVCGLLPFLIGFWIGGMFGRRRR